jgi:ABC-type transport system involved in multi-copper enzyme maturation permease subunit
VHNPTFGALFHNEMEKLWAHRLRALIIAFCVIVIGGSLLKYRSFEVSQHQVKQNIQQIETQIRTLKNQEKHATGNAKSQIQQNIASEQQFLQQVRTQRPGTVNLRAQEHALEQSLNQQPASQRGAAEEQLALIRYTLAHGYHSVAAPGGSAYSVVGSVFGGLAMLLFGLIAAGLGSDRVSAELEGGTLGVLLLHAPRRAPVYRAKFLASVAMTWAFMAASALGFWLLLGALIGFGSPGLPVAVGVHMGAGASPGFVSVLPGAFHIIPQWAFDLWSLGLAMAAIAALQAIFVAVSILTRATIFSLVIGAVLVISGVIAAVAARTMGWLVVADPAVHLPLAGDWTGTLAGQYNLAALTLPHGLIVLGLWTVAALAAGLIAMRRLDL